jgi:uncharacterized membrane protein YqjE
VSPEPGGGAPQPGLIAALRGLLGGAAELAHSRLHLLAADLEEAGVRIGATVIYALLALYLAFIGLVLAVMFVVVMFWQHSPLLAIGILCALFLGAALGCALLALATARARPRLFETTIGELRKDAQRLRGGR